MLFTLSEKKINYAASTFSESKYINIYKDFPRTDKWCLLFVPKPQLHSLEVFAMDYIHQKCLVNSAVCRANIIRETLLSEYKYCSITISQLWSCFIAALESVSRCQSYAVIDCKQFKCHLTVKNNTFVALAFVEIP